MASICGHRRPSWFHAPTVFARDGRTWPIPDPTAGVGSLTRRWNAHSPIAIDGDYVRAVGSHLDVTRLDGRTTSAVAGQGGYTIGFVGRLDVALRPSVSITHRQVLSTLAHSAEFLGVGKQTTYGFDV